VRVQRAESRRQACTKQIAGKNPPMNPNLSLTETKNLAKKTSRHIVLSKWNRLDGRAGFSWVLEENQFEGKLRTLVKRRSDLGGGQPENSKAERGEGKDKGS